MADDWDNDGDLDLYGDIQVAVPDTFAQPQPTPTPTPEEDEGRRKRARQDPGPEGGETHRFFFSSISFLPCYSSRTCCILL